MSRTPAKRQPARAAEKPTDKTEQIQAAVARLLGGTPLHAEPGRLSVLALAVESGVDRNTLNRHYEKLITDFRDRVAGETTPEPTTPRERTFAQERDALATDLDEMREKYRDERRSRALWKKAAESFARVVQVRLVEIRKMESDLQTQRNRISRLEAEREELRGEVQRLLRESAVDPDTGVVALRAVPPHDD